jgi:hypothetical protein
MHRETEKQQRKAENNPKTRPQLPGKGEKLKTQTQGKPDGVRDRLAITALQ